MWWFSNLLLGLNMISNPEGLNSQLLSLFNMKLLQHLGYAQATRRAWGAKVTAI